MTFMETVYRGDVVVVLNTEEATSVPWETLIGKVAEQLGKTRFALGERKDSAAGIVSSYHKALERLRREEDTQHNGFDARETGQDNLRHGTSEMTAYTLDMLGGNYVDAKKRVGFLCNQYIGEDPSLFSAKCKRAALLNPVLEALHRLPKQQGDLLISWLEENDDDRMLPGLLDKILTELARERIAAPDKVSGANAAQQAKEYIHGHYTDPMLGLYTIAEHLQVTNSYLSGAFKKAFGIGVAQYINKCRIEKAKTFLLNSNDSLKEIALKVGFSSDVTFIRVFKQHENMTPGKYR